MLIRRTTVAAAAATLLLAPLAASAAPAQVFRGDLVDLSATTADPFGDASAHLVITPTGKGTTFHLRIKGIDPAVAGEAYGAHLHVGPCVAGKPALAGPHYNSTGQPPTKVSPDTEVWLDFTVTGGGTGVSVTTVPFVPTADARSVVIHAEPTSPTGAAGARQACLPVVW